MSFGFELPFDDSTFSNIFRFQKVVFLGIKLRILMSLLSSSSKRLIMVFIVEKLNDLTSITSVVEGGMTLFYGCGCYCHFHNHWNGSVFG